MLKLSRLPTGGPEIFASIQGEGPTRGLPSVFVRLALCNLRCAWCDTKYTWDWEHYDRSAETIDLAVERIVDEARRLHHRNVVITGGEPLLQQTALRQLLIALKSIGHRTEVETNGTIIATGLAPNVDQWNVSPKLPNSENALALRENASALSWFTAQPNAFFKLVVSSPSDLDDVDRLVGAYAIPPFRVVLMPEADNELALAERARWLIPACHTAGYGFSPRLQVTLWGAARGR